MHLVLDGRPPRARRRSSTRPAPAVSVLRWRSGPGTGGVHPLFSVNEAGRLGASALQSPDSPDGDNVLLVGSSRRAEPGPPGIVLSLVNTSPTEAVTLSVKLAGPTPTSVTGTILSAPPMAPVCPGIFPRNLDVLPATSHSESRPPEPTDTSVLPSGEKATVRVVPPCNQAVSCCRSPVMSQRSVPPPSKAIKRRSVKRKPEPHKRSRTKRQRSKIRLPRQGSPSPSKRTSG